MSFRFYSSVSDHHSKSVRQTQEINGNLTIGLHSNRKEVKEYEKGYSICHHRMPLLRAGKKGAGKEKIYEAHVGEKYDECKAHVKQVLEAAMA